MNLRYYLAFSPEAESADEDTLEFPAKNAVDDEIYCTHRIFFFVRHNLCTASYAANFQ